MAATSLTALSAVYFAPLGDWLADDPLPGQAWHRTSV
jgi:hypothetical protein